MGSLLAENCIGWTGLVKIFTFKTWCWRVSSLSCQKSFVHVLHVFSSDDLLLHDEVIFWIPIKKEYLSLKFSDLWGMLMISPFTLYQSEVSYGYSILFYKQFLGNAVRGKCKKNEKDFRPRGWSSESCFHILFKDLCVDFNIAVRF